MSNNNYSNLEKFYHACLSGDLNKVNEFLDDSNNLGIDIHSENDKALMYAIKYKRLEIVYRLLEYDPTNINFNSTMLYCISTDCVEIIKKVLDRKKTFSLRQIEYIYYQITQKQPENIKKFIISNLEGLTYLSKYFELKTNSINGFIPKFCEIQSKIVEINESVSKVLDCSIIDKFLELMEKESKRTIKDSDPDVKLRKEINKGFQRYIDDYLIPSKDLKVILLKMFKIILESYLEDDEFYMSYYFFDEYCKIFEKGLSSISENVFRSNSNILYSGFKHIYFKISKKYRAKYTYRIIHQQQSNKNFERFLELYFVTSLNFMSDKNKKSFFLVNVIQRFKNDNLLYQEHQTEHYKFLKYILLTPLDSSTYSKDFKKINTYITKFIDIRYKYSVEYMNQIKKALHFSKIPNEVYKDFIFPFLNLQEEQAKTIVTYN